MADTDFSSRLDALETATQELRKAFEVTEEAPPAKPDVLTKLEALEKEVAELKEAAAGKKAAPPFGQKPGGAGGGAGPGPGGKAPPFPPKKPGDEEAMDGDKKKAKTKKSDAAEPMSWPRDMATKNFLDG